LGIEEECAQDHRGAFHDRSPSWLRRHPAAPATASRMTSITGPGALTNGVWSTLSDRIRAAMRFAMKSWVAGLIIRSSAATRYQEGFALQVGLAAFSWMHRTAIGRCVAARSAILSGDACWQNAVPNASCGIQMKPCASDARWGAWGCGFPR